LEQAETVEQEEFKVEQQLQRVLQLQLILVLVVDQVVVQLELQDLSLQVETVELVVQVD
jgi:hypothetical protein